MLGGGDGVHFAGAYFFFDDGGVVRDGGVVSEGVEECFMDEGVDPF